MATDEVKVKPSVFNPIGAHTQIAALGLAAAVTLTPPAGANYLQIQFLAQNVRYTLDGSAPTAVKGFRVIAGKTISLLMTPGEGALELRVIEEAVSATAEYQWGIV